jgi:CubicO group peptidase (beta-lactamase class C family)
MSSQAAASLHHRAGDPWPPIAEPESVGMDSERLGRIGEHLQGYLDRRQLPGWQVAVMRRGALVHLESRGMSDVENHIAVTTDTVWRIYSMTKPITTVAALILWEQGRFELTDPVRQYLPAFADQRVWRSGSTTSHLLDPVTEPMRIWHLMTHTSGLSYGFMQAHPVDELYRRAGFDWGVPADHDLEATVDRLATLPLLFQPGTEWNYSMATDVLGRLIEVICGTTLDEALRRLVLDPLGMRDTAFWAHGPLADRLAALYVPSPGTGEIFRFDQLGAPALRKPMALLGGGGLVSTTTDYLAFAEMLRCRGLGPNGVRLIGTRTARYLASNHLPGNADLSTFGRPLFSETTFDGVGFGLGVSVTIDPVAAKVPGSVGDHGWGGAASTAFWVDPVEELSVVFMTQLLPSSTHPLRSQLRQMVMQAIID